MRLSSHLQRYRSLIFDCDGVILDSNTLKTRAFREVAGVYGYEAADRLVAHHKRHGGVSRYDKFDYLFRSILGREPKPGEMQGMLNGFAERVEQGLSSCPVAARLDELRRATSNATWLVVSGSDQQELRRVLASFGIAQLFDGGIFGSPASKTEILSQRLACGALSLPAVYFGDSVGDAESAKEAGVDFVFVYGWTEVENWRELFEDGKTTCVCQVADVLDGPVGEAASRAT